MGDPIADNDTALRQALVDMALGKPFIPRFTHKGIEQEGEPEVPKASVRLEALKLALTFQEPDESAPLGKLPTEELEARAQQIRQRQALAVEFKVVSNTPAGDPRPTSEQAPTLADDPPPG